MSESPMPPKLVDDMVRRAALNTLELARETDIWDVTPMLGLVGVDDAGEPNCIHVPVPDDLWRSTHPARVLHTMAYAVDHRLVELRLSEPYDPGEILGVILVTEGHNIDMHALTDAERETFDDFKAKHRLEEHPKSRELRMAQIIDRSLTTAVIRHFRGDAVSPEVIYGTTGTVPEALTRFVTSVMASWISVAGNTD